MKALNYLIGFPCYALPATCTWPCPDQWRYLSVFVLVPLSATPDPALELVDMVLQDSD